MSGRKRCLAIAVYYSSIGLLNITIKPSVMINMPRRTRKCIAALLLLIFTTSTFTPGVAFALTSGPTSPEATSFEPVDTTDMVNLQTGDFTYNIPLLEVPGPEGGYPLSLSYHAGIQPNEDASWVGLGWTLNPGAISRNVNGYPDDWYNPSGNAHAYWSGGTTTTFDVGINIGLGGSPASASFGLSFSQDTYQGFGVGFNFSIGMPLAEESPLSASLGVGVSPDGQGVLTGGLTGATHKGPFGFAGDLQFSTNFESLNAGASVRTSLAGLLGTSLSTGSSKPSLSVGGLTHSVTSTNNPGIQTSESSYGLTIPLPWFSVSLGYSKKRYWTDETTSVTTHGSLYSSGWTLADNRAYDTYSLLEDPNDKNIVEYPDPAKLQGGAYLDFDLYSVNAQGLGGNIRPYLFQGEVLGQNRKDGGNYLVQYYSPGVTNNIPQFRFVNDFSNSYRQNDNFYPSSSVAAPGYNLSTEPLPFDGSPVYGNSDGNYGYGSSGALAGSRHIDVGVRIQPSNAIGYTKTDRYQSFMIDGFSITNESGITYHYGLPAYAWGEESYQQRIDQSGGLAFNRSKKPNAYAYTWYLTSITGPDFVDRNDDSKAGAGDWGYWVNFEYGKWSNSYVWRNPSEGFHRDEDNEFQNCSMGYKEVYYLNAIRTRSHIALFEKDIRYDGKGASPAVFNTNTSGSTPTSYSNNGVFDINSSQSLQLSKIYLMNVADASVQSTAGGSSAYRPSSRTISCSDCELAANTLDKTDIDAAGRSSIESNSIRIIDFTYDYTTCAKTANSYDINSSTSKSGKLTLKSIKSKGKKGISLLPPTTFDYDLSPGDAGFKAQTGVVLATTGFFANNDSFEIGDLIQQDGVSGVYCGSIVSKTPVGGGTYNYALVNSTYAGSPITTDIHTTKNPPYLNDAYDLWGLYKSDFDNSIVSANENLGRLTSIGSAKGTDAWSLRKITSSLGSAMAIEFEADEYKSVLNDNGSILTNGISGTNGVNPNSKAVLSFTTQNFKIITEQVAVGDKIDFVALQQGRTAFPLVEFIYYKPLDSRVVFPAPVTITSIDAGNKTITTDASFPDLFNYNYHNLNFHTETIVRGNVLIGKSIPRFGGGLRVSKISTLGQGYSRSTNYGYRRPGDSKSYGFTTYEPTVFDICDFSGLTYSLPPDYKRDYRKAVYKDINSLLAIAREVPPPGVMYEYVTVTSQVKNTDEQSARDIEGSVQYQYEVFRENMIGRMKLSGYSGYAYDGKSANLTMKKFIGAIGNVKRIAQYDNRGKKLTETINHFLHDGLETLSLTDFMDQYKTRLAQYNYQGYLQERYAEVKNVSNQANSADNGLRATVSAREEYPCISTGQTVINYVNGTRTSSENIGYDFYSGALTKTVETDAYGNRMMTEVVPAYTQTAYGSMGLKINDQYKKHMLTQQAGVYMWKVDGSNNKLGLVSANVNTWGNGAPVLDESGNSVTQNANNTTQGNVWRMQSTYNWMPDTKTADGLTATGNFTQFNWATPGSSSAEWKKTSDITLYDVYSKSVEGKDINGNYSATRLDYGSKKVSVTGSPANYYEIAYSGAEDDGINQSNDVFVKKVDGIATSTIGTTHTGSRSLRLEAGGTKKCFVYTVSTDKLVAGRNYIANVWVKPVTGTAADAKLYYDINGTVKATSVSSGSSTKTADGWILLDLLIDGADIAGGTTLHVGCRNDHSSAEVYVDDMRFRPANAVTTAYVYDNFSGELTYILNNNNLYTKYKYDAAGRLVNTYVEKLGTGVVKATETQYNNSVFYGNSSAISRMMRKNDCAVGVGSSVGVYVGAGTVFSLSSQEDANEMAEIAAQKQANSSGTCLSPGIYARVETYYSNTWYDNNYPTYVSYYAEVELWVKFYSDEACTQPFTLTDNITFTVEWQTLVENEFAQLVSNTFDTVFFGADQGTDGVMIDNVYPIEGDYRTYDQSGNVNFAEIFRCYYKLTGTGSPTVILPSVYH